MRWDLSFERFFLFDGPLVLWYFGLADKTTRPTSRSSFTGENSLVSYGAKLLRALGVKEKVKRLDWRVTSGLAEMSGCRTSNGDKWQLGTPYPIK